MKSESNLKISIFSNNGELGRLNYISDNLFKKLIIPIEQKVWNLGCESVSILFEGEKNSLIIGNNNKFREYVNINPGTEQGGGITRVGDNNLFLVYCHVAHDCLISDNIVLANNVQVGGHVTIQNNAIVGGSCAIHQFSRIGEAVRYYKPFIRHLRLVLYEAVW